MTLLYFDRKEKKVKEEKVYGEKLIQFLYGKSPFAPFFRSLFSKIPLFSALFGFWQKMPWTKKNIAPFIETFEIDSSEFEPAETFHSFNDFFVRKLYPHTRPIAHAEAVIPADGRWRVFKKADHIQVKGTTLSLAELVGSESLAARYLDGTALIGRLCPSDYHRFHFPVDCTPKKTKMINGWLYSVNPWAIQHNIKIYSQNKRAITPLESPHFGKVLMIEVGATNVGSIRQTFKPNTSYQKGNEKGYFEFGASAIVLLFLPNTLKVAPDLINEGNRLEVFSKMGEPLTHIG